MAPMIQAYLPSATTPTPPVASGSTVTERCPERSADSIQDASTTRNVSVARKMTSPKQAKSTTAIRASRTPRTRAFRATKGETVAAAEEGVHVAAKAASGKKAITVKKGVEVEEPTIAIAAKSGKRKINGAVKVEDDESELSELEEEPQSAPKKRKTTKAKPSQPAESDGEGAEAKPKKKRRTKAEREAEEAMVLAARTATSALKRAMFIGAHVSAAGGVHNSIQNATKIGANAFALFLKSQRKWENPPLQDEHRDEFRRRLKSHVYDAGKHVLPHGSYLVNLAQADKARADQAYQSFIDDLRRCEALGIRLYNFHPGATGGDTKEAACGRIAAQLNRAIAETKFVVPLLECMCGAAAGNVVGSRFEELRDIIALIEDKNRVGVCLDTCHAFAAGYDLRTPEAFEETMTAFDEIVGMKYLKALHLNDSKAPFASHRDLHANIGTGFLGLQTFHNVMNYEPFQQLPMVLETPIEVKGPDGKMVENKQIWADEIKLLESLIGMDPESDAFKARAEELQARGAGERARIQEQVDRKVEKDAKKAVNEAKKAAKGASNGGQKKSVKRKPSLKTEESTPSSLSSLSSACDSCGGKSS